MSPVALQNRVCRLTLMVSWSVCVTGCGPRLPMYPLIDSATTIAMMAERGGAIETLGARCRFILERPGDRSVELTAALVSRPPSHHRLRAWKLTEPVMDITITEDEGWVWARDKMHESNDAGILAGFAPETGAMDYLREGFNLAFGAMDVSQWTEAPHGSDNDNLVMDRRVNDGATLRCVIHRLSLTVIAFHVIDADGRTRFTLRLDRYRRFGPAVLPTRLRGEADDHRFALMLHGVDVNGELPGGAFRPPRGATRP